MRFNDSALTHQGMSTFIVDKIALAVQLYGPVTSLQSLQHVIIAIERTGANQTANSLSIVLQQFVSAYLSQQTKWTNRHVPILLPTYIDKTTVSLVDSTVPLPPTIQYGVNTHKASRAYRDILFDYLLSRYLVCFSHCIDKIVDDPNLRHVFRQDMTAQRNKRDKGPRNKYDWLDSFLVATEVNSPNLIGVTAPDEIHMPHLRTPTELNEATRFIYVA